VTSSGDRITVTSFGGPMLPRTQPDLASRVHITGAAASHTRCDHAVEVAAETMLQRPNRAFLNRFGASSLPRALHVELGVEVGEPSTYRGTKQEHVSTSMPTLSARSRKHWVAPSGSVKYLPTANVKRVMQNAAPAHCKISKGAIDFIRTVCCPMYHSHCSIFCHVSSKCP
jgi:hypothetical protein